MPRTVAVILGGGRGTRLDPLTRQRAKPAVPLAGKYRLIDVPISNCINSGLRRIFVLTQFETASLHRHIRTTYNFDTFSSGYVHILSAEQTADTDAWYQGTADAVRRNLRHLELDTADRILILSGDQLYRADFHDLMHFHEDCQAQVTVAALEVTREQAPELGILQTEGPVISHFVEKPRTAAELDRLALPEPRNGNTHLASMGIYLFEKECLLDLLADEKQEDFGKQVIPTAISKYHTCAYPFSGYWEDIGTIRAFYEANLALTNPVPRFNFFDEEAPIYTHPRHLPPAKINHCCIEHSVVADGCIIDRCEITGSVIGVRTTVGEGTVIRDSIVMGQDYFESDGRLQENDADIPMGIGRQCLIEGAIIDKNCRLGNNVTIRRRKNSPDEDTDFYVVRDDVVIIPRNTAIPDGTVI